LTAVIDHAAAVRLRFASREVAVSDGVRRYLLDLITATRTHKAIHVGASPRAAIGLQRAAQARALLKGRDFVIPDDVQALASSCLAHRLGVRLGQPPGAVVQALLESLPVPR